MSFFILNQLSKLHVIYICESIIFNLVNGHTSDGTMPKFCTMPIPKPSKSPDALYALYIHGYIINIEEAIPIPDIVFIYITFFADFS